LFLGMLYLSELGGGTGQCHSGRPPKAVYRNRLAGGPDAKQICRRRPELLLLVTKFYPAKPGTKTRCTSSVNCGISVSTSARYRSSLMSSTSFLPRSGYFPSLTIMFLPQVALVQPTMI